MPAASDVLLDVARLRAVRDTGLLDTLPEESFDRLTRLAARVCDAPVSMVNVIDERRQFSKSCFAPPGWSTGREASLEDSLCRHAVISAEPVMIPDTRESPLSSSSSFVTGQGMRSYLGAPLITAEGQVLGTLCVADLVPRAWDAEQVETLTDIAAAVVTEIELRRDLTVRARVEEALRAARDEAERANRAKSEFLSRMSHELRTPLNAILGFAQLLEMDLQREDDRESVDQILRSGRHLLALINEVLDIARIESGRVGLSIEPVPVGELIGDSLDLVRPMAVARGIELRVDCSLEPGPLVWADEQRLKQVLLNLLSNAIKFNRPGGTITLSCEAVGEGRVRIRVHDTGPGIPADKLDRLFVPFERLGAELRGVEGTGLGLVLSKSLVEAMEGRLGVESEEGEGSVFWVELPCPEPDEAAPAREAARAGGRRSPAEPTHTVLLVEDNLANGRLIGHVFQRRPQVRLLTAMQGRRALELAREYHPDLIILDLNLPDLSGDQVLEQLQDDPELRGVPVVMISGGATSAEVEQLLSAGARAFLSKPFELQELLRVVDESLRGAER